MRKIIENLERVLRAGQAVAYTALVETRGSTPQKPGAAMLVFPDGSQAGTLGGGCVEAEVKRRAQALIDTGVDYTHRDNVAERLAKKFGASIGEGAMHALHAVPLLR